MQSTASSSLSPLATQVLTRAREESLRYRQRMVGSEHLLLALLLTPGSLAGLVLQSFGVTEARMREAVELIAGRGTLRYAADASEHPLTQRTGEALELAGYLARAFGQTQVQPEHLLLALLEFPGSAALGVLQTLGIAREYLRDRTFTFMAQPTPLAIPDTARLSHLDAQGRARMVDVGAKPETEREAIARGMVLMQPATLRLITSGAIAKGDVLATARIAGIMAAKRTSELIPLCHPLMLTHVSVELQPDAERSAIQISATVRTHGRTGVEMEALTAVTVAALTIYDMCKAVDRGMRLSEIRLAEKRGGTSGALVLEQPDGAPQAAE
nr:cyclic pyranopterin monophosphate synthase MoaC [Kallotenue papyrolyticum]